jgi:hypothetical protein
MDGCVFASVIAGWNPARGIDVCVLRVLCVVLSGKSLCDGPMPRPEESNRV